MTNLQMLVRRHQEKAAQVASQSADWSQRKAKWLSVLQQLTGQIRTLLIAAGVPEQDIVVTQHQITEETLGSYAAPGLQLHIGTATVQFVPVASVIIGGGGRVDVTGPRGEVKLIADDGQALDAPEDAEPAHERAWVWSAYPDKSRRSGFRLDDDGLAKLLGLVLGNA